MNKILFIVPARKGSQRIPGKNKEKVGKWTLHENAVITSVLVAKGLFGRKKNCAEILVSTDDEEIVDHWLDIGGSIKGIPLTVSIRPQQYADGDVWDLVRYILKTYPSEEERTIVVMQPTSPFRRIYTMEDFLCDYGFWGAGPEPIYRFKTALTPPTNLTIGNGLVYVFSEISIKKSTPGYVDICKPIEWWESFEIDTPEDLEYAKSNADLMDMELQNFKY